MSSTRRLVSLAASNTPRATALSAGRSRAATYALRPGSSTTSAKLHRGLATATPFPPPSPRPDGSSPPPPGSGGARVGTVFWALVGAGIAATSYGLYSYLDSFRTWPAELRPDLRAALKAHRAGDIRRAEAMYKDALAKALAMDRAKLEPNALLKLTGLFIAFGSFYEEQGRLLEAYETYNDGLQMVQEQGKTGEERMRAVAISQKLGDLAKVAELAQELPPLSTTALAEGTTSVAEMHLRWSVEELLRLLPLDSSTVSDKKGEFVADDNSQAATLLSDLELPPWVTKASLGASLEALGQLYAAQGRAEYAVPLYIQALDLLMPSNKAKRRGEPTASERCRAGILMNNVAQLLVDDRDVKGKDMSAKVQEALAWAIKGLDIVAFTQRAAGWDGKAGPGVGTVVESDAVRTQQVRNECAAAEVALLWNLGELSRMNKDDCKARNFWQRAYQRADTYGMREARSRAAQGLSQLERTSSAASLG